MNLITPLLSNDNIILDADINSKKRLFEEVGRLCEQQINLSQSEVFDCLFAREKLGSTGLGQGVAIPHGRLAGVKQAVAAFIRLKEPIEFESPDNKPVQLVFAMIVPEDANSQHLEVLSQLADVFSDKNAREALLNADHPEAVLAVFSRED
ncbi:MAG: PTS IIA-like nitrogen regulatory protein PtsN [Neisseriaceae bacterium]|nr:PTS IIA-like nitrogen regulatory protein PtsN [Neisseriaceae bacterium]